MGGERAGGNSLGCDWRKRMLIMESRNSGGTRGKEYVSDGLMKCVREEAGLEGVECNGRRNKGICGRI